ncbi:MAG: hypothetical protein JNK05_22880 [Myxococcales bacterium]|nr:hypothetical protein [Myxococcales bacterium]
MLLIVPFLVLASWLSSLAANLEPPQATRPTYNPRPTSCFVQHQPRPMIIRRTVFVRYEPARFHSFLR